MGLNKGWRLWWLLENKICFKGMIAATIVGRQDCCQRAKNAWRVWQLSERKKCFKDIVAAREQKMLRGHHCYWRARQLLSGKTVSKEQKMFWGYDNWWRVKKRLKRVQWQSERKNACNGYCLLGRKCQRDKVRASASCENVMT